MNSTKHLPVWYAGGLGNNRNVLKGVGQLIYAGFFISLTFKIMNTNALSKEEETRLLKQERLSIMTAFFVFAHVTLSLGTLNLTNNERK
jgi:hypothetical protein